MSTISLLSTKLNLSKTSSPPTSTTMGGFGFPGCGGCVGLLNNEVEGEEEGGEELMTKKTKKDCNSAIDVAKAATNAIPATAADSATTTSTTMSNTATMTTTSRSALGTTTSTTSSSSNHRITVVSSSNICTSINNISSSNNSSKKSKNSNSIGQRCYRLNLERPFDIHCEQSPLEYGDYMAPWSKEVYPITVGPTEYCPPRHLGGNIQVWQELLRRRCRHWSSNSAEDSRTVASAAASADAIAAGEEKVNSLDILDNAMTSNTMGEEDAATAVVVVAATDRGGADHGNKDFYGDIIVGRTTNATTSVRRRNDDGEEEDASTGIVLTMSSSSSTSTTGYRCLTSQEQIVIQKSLREQNYCGEYTFEAYDLTHVIQPHQHNDIPRSKNHNNKSNYEEGRQGGRELRTVFSMESSTSEEELMYPITAEEIAQNTARLFRRSELSIRERSDGTEDERLRQQYQQQRHDGEDKGVSGPLSDDSKADRSGAIGGGAGIGGEGKGKKKKSRSSTLSSGGKKLFRSLSKALSDMQGTPAPSSGMHSRSTSSGVSGSGIWTGMDKRSSMQALIIDKARDLVDASDDGEGNAGGENGNKAKTKPLNVSLYIVGEYDILNDLVNDGAKRLRENKDVSDLYLSLQNDPCPPPNRWVRPTGWGKCNPGSMYAKHPPEDFDWVRYYDKLRIKTGPSTNRMVSRDGRQQVSRVGHVHNDDVPHSHRQDGTTDTQTTAVVVSSSDLSGDIDQHDEHHHVGGRLIKVTRASSSMPMSTKSPERELHRSFAASVAQSPGLSVTPLTRSNTAPARTASAGYGGVRSRFTQPKVLATLSKSATTPTSALSASTPSGVVSTNNNNSSGVDNNNEGIPKSSLGRKLSGIFGLKKNSSGAE